MRAIPLLLLTLAMAAPLAAADHWIGFAAETTCSVVQRDVLTAPTTDVPVGDNYVDLARYEAERPRAQCREHLESVRVPVQVDGL